MRFLIVGGSGFLGGELARQCSAAGHEVTATYLTRSGDAANVEWSPLDVRRREDVDALVGAFRPEVVINAAFRQTDWATTAIGAVNVALAASAAGGRLVHVSSDAVFSGAAIRYDETCVPDPITPYGAAKAAAETAVAAIAPTSVTARTSLIIGDGGSSHEVLVHSLATATRDVTASFSHEAGMALGEMSSAPNGNVPAGEAWCLPLRSRGSRWGRHDAGRAQGGHRRGARTVGHG
ncbi:sugar nucleotide-binding protein [Streptosporangium sp. H16]|uniref:sugar nucleotide-binding protein n=1 Tax=Streptosporangium sp. H16 TaxID=3444184 RepID=UPI003F7A24C6